MKSNIKERLDDLFDKVEVELKEDSAKAEHFGWHNEFEMAESKLTLLEQLRKEIMEIVE